MGKYDGLSVYLSELDHGTHTLQMSDLESIIGGTLPDSAMTQTWWSFLEKPVSNNKEIRQITLNKENRSVTFEITNIVMEFEKYKKSQLNFDLRWGIESNESNETFKARITIELGGILDTLSAKKEFCLRFYSVIGTLPKYKTDVYGIGRFQLLATIVGNNDVVTIVKYIQVCFDILHQLLWLEELYTLQEAVERVIGISRNSPIFIATDEVTGSIQLYKSGAKLLDEKVINADLHWLSSYPKVESFFNQALINYRNFDGSDPQVRSIYDDLRTALETLIRAILGNQKVLANNRSGICEWLKSRGTHANVVNIYNFIVNQFDSFMNDPKHGGDYNPNDLEFMIYQTGILMKAILEKSSLGNSII